jgi:GR25 family glycosyltransferase involved in LPS biosynthesis
MHTKIINLDFRTDRWETVVPEVSRFGITDIERVDACKGGYMGFNRSVKKALQGEGELLLLEDDVIFYYDFEDVRTEFTIKDLHDARALLPSDWDLLYLGANLKSPQLKYNSKLYRITDAWTSHAILYSVKGRAYCRDHFDPEKEVIYDEWLRTHAQKNLQCFVIAPMIAFQADGWSDIWGANAVYGLRWSEKYFV